MGATTTLVQLVRTGARLAGQVLLARFGRETVERSNRAARVLVDRVGVGLDLWALGSGIGSSTARYGDYFSTSTSVHAAVRVRAHAVGRPPLQVHEVGVDGGEIPVPPGHPLQALLDHPNPFWTPGEMWHATETYLSLFGAAYWGLERDESGVVNLLRQSWADLDSHELRLLLDKRIGGPGQYDGRPENPDRFYLPRARILPNRAHL